MTDEELETLIRKTVKDMSPPFDTHKLILLLAQQNQRQYVEALYKTKGRTPFLALHSRIGKILGSISEDLQLQRADWRSLDIFKQKSVCQRYTRLKKRSSE